MIGCTCECIASLEHFHKAVDYFEIHVHMTDDTIRQWFFIYNSFLTFIRRRENVDHFINRSITAIKGLQYAQGYDV
jgi:hypothetical protein